MSYRWDGMGTQTLTLRQAQGGAWNLQNRLSQVVGSGGYSGMSSYVYDGDGRRIQKVESGNTVVYPNRYYEKNVTNTNAGNDVAWPSVPPFVIPAKAGIQFFWLCLDSGSGPE